VFLGLWIVMIVGCRIDRERTRRVVALWAAVFAASVLAFVLDYTVLPRLDHRYRAVLFPGDRLGTELSQRFRAATGRPIAYVIGDKWVGGNVAHYAPEQPRLLIDGNPARAPWIDLDDLRRRGGVIVWAALNGVRTRGGLWKQGDFVPTQYAWVAPGLRGEPPIEIPLERGPGGIVVGWKIVPPAE
jgi:hypothetical protein